MTPSARRFGPGRMLARIDLFLVGMVVTVVIATLLPASGALVPVAQGVSTAAIALLFFLNGVRLSTADAVRGLRHWRLHTTVLVVSFLVFPLLGFAFRLFVPWLLTPTLYLGVMFLSTLPSTVQSSIAFTSIAKGNVGAAVGAASISNILGVFISPLLIALFMSKNASISPGSVLALCVQIIVPFIAGQLLRRWLAAWVEQHPVLIRIVDRGSILLVVYSAFSESVVSGIWQQLSVLNILAVLLVDGLLLALVLTLTWFGSGLLRFSREDRIAIMFCGSKKSLTTGVPIAAVQFAGPALGFVIFPLILFHQIQIFVCAILARRFAGADTGRAEGADIVPAPA
jgi:sodium/bile acid cotransporter 7